MDKLILLSMIVSATMLLTRDARDVFILVFIPVLTLLPTYFDTKIIPGTPELTFYSAALIPIVAAWMLRNFEGYRFHWMDVVVMMYILTVFYGQWSNSTYKEAQKILYNNMMTIFFPYVMTRSFCQDQDTMIRMIRILTVLGAVIAVFNIIEFRMFTNYFDEILRRIWPRQVMWDTGMVMSRWGFKRAFGPFSHPIVAGYFFSLMSPLSIWCYYQKRYLNPNIGKAIILLNTMGIFVSISRAPILGFFLGLIIIFYGWSKNKAAVAAVLIIVLTIMLMFLVPKFIDYASVTRATAETVGQRNVAYRKEMWEAYAEVVMERPYLGWGRFTVPSVKGMKSIDSEYLGVALASGIIALFFYLTFLLGIMKKLLRFAYDRPHDNPWACLTWCIMAGWVTAIFTQMTVYSGAQSVPYLFMLGGLGQAVVLGSPNGQLSMVEPEVNLAFAGRGFGFVRVL
jgi:hypothetical protein